MPYKDPARKAQWERLHRAQRLARRRALRRLEADSAAPTAFSEADLSRRDPNARVPSPWLPLALGVGVSFFKPRWGMVLGAGVILIAIAMGLSWVWYFVGGAFIAVSMWSTISARPAGSALSK